MKNRVSCKKPYLRENKDKRRGDWREKRERRNMIGYQFILKKLSIGDVVSMSSIYMTWQI